MTLIYKFKKEKLKNGIYATRPRILVMVSNKDSAPVPALLDSGCDRTVIPEFVAKSIGLDMTGPKTNLAAYRESQDVIESKANITFFGRVERESIKITVPVLISLGNDECDHEEEVVLGVDGIFDEFEVTFKKRANRIILKRIDKVKF